jgi:hypothetical protein
MLLLQILRMVLTLFNSKFKALRAFALKAFYHSTIIMFSCLPSSRMISLFLTILFSEFL